LASAHAQITGTSPNFTLSSGTENDGTYTLTDSTLTQSGGTLNVGTFTLSGDSTYNISAGTGAFTDVQMGFMFNPNAIAHANVNQSGGNVTVSNNLWLGAHTAYGTCGIKVWIFKGEILEHDPFGSEKRAMEGTEGTRRGHAA